MRIRGTLKLRFVFFILSCLFLSGCATASEDGKLSNEKCKALEKLTQDAADKFVALQVEAMQALQSGDTNVDEINAEADLAMADAKKYGAEMDAGGCKVSE